MKVRYYAPRKQCRKRYGHDFLYYRVWGDKVLVVHNYMSYFPQANWESIWDVEGTLLRRVREAEVALL